MRRRLSLVALLAGFLLAGCGGASSVSIGSKDFSEQRILAEMVALMAEDAGLRVDRVVPYPPDISPFQGLRDATIDVYVEYTGTGLLALGQPPLTDSDAAFDLVADLSDNLGLTWLPRLGFENAWALSVTEESAARFGLSTISDLSRLSAASAPVRFAVNGEFERRPLDGLDALASRYGLVPDPDTFVTDDKAELYQALRAGAVDVAVGFGTDPQVEQLDLVVLRDDLAFFPAYDAAPVATTAVLDAQPSLADALGALAGQIDEATMRELVRQVDFEQREPSAVARDALVSLGLIPAGQVADRADAVLVSIGLDDQRSGPTGLALEAISQAYPGRPIEVVVSEDPADAVLRGDSRLAIADAETVFQPIERDAGEQRPVKPLEAIAAVELRAVHLLAPGTDSEITTVAVAGANSPSRETALTLLETGVLPEVTLVELPGRTVADRVDAVTAGEADAALVVSALGQADVQTAVSESGLVLRSVAPVAGPPVLQAPHLRLGVIPAGTYVGQANQVTTFTQQAVVLGPVSEANTLAIYGPNAFVGGAAQPLSSAATQSIRAALDEPRVDPVLPRTPTPLTDPAELLQPTNPEPWVSVANLLLLAALGALGYALVRKPRPTAPSSSHVGDEESRVP